ncbi:MAG: pyruvate kinase [Bacteroidota bacterium]
MSTTTAKGRTKIVCTIGPATQSVEQLVRLIEEGMDVARLNFSHGSHDDHLTVMRNVREACKQTGEHITVLQDLCGPKIRTGTMKNKKAELKEGSTVVFTTEEIEGDEHRITTAYKELPEDVKPGDGILLDDGKLCVRVVSTTKTEVVCKVETGGILGEHKGMNLPGVKLSTPSLTEKDLDDLEFGLKNDIDYVALSFVRSADDIRSLRGHILKQVKHFVPIIAKIEMADAIQAIDDIINESDAVMVARGDLGVEMPPEEVPVLQKMIVRKCNEAGKPVIIATQMLESMIENPRPTRAEASDVANAVLDGADAVMLSAETSVGKYPIETVKTMNNIILRTEQQVPEKEIFEKRPFVRDDTVLDAVAQSACVLAEKVNASAIIPITHSGATAWRLSRFRPSARIIAVTGEEHVLRRLNLVWGVQGIVLTDYIGNADAILHRIKEKLKQDGYLKSGDYIVFTIGIPLMARGLTDTINVERVD